MARAQPFKAGMTSRWFCTGIHHYRPTIGAISRMRAFGFELDESPAAAPPWRTPVSPRPAEINDTIDEIDENGGAPAPHLLPALRRRYLMWLCLFAPLDGGATYSPTVS